ncbi:MAG: exo-alpha-sialidase [Clostridia bacterium]|nr:exo-alpha-sialidase [Clostridia bacterium]
MINNTLVDGPYRVEVEHVEIGPPREGHSYAHHASLAVFQDKLYAIWSNGRFNEDDVRQRVMIAYRETDGNWSTPCVLADHVMAGSTRSVLTATGMHVYGDTLIAYVGCYEYDEAQLDEKGDRPKKDAHHQNTRCGYLTSTDGIHWSEITWLPLYMVPNHGPRATRSGRLIISGNISFPYTDDPKGVSEYIVTGVYGNCFDGRPVIDDSESIQWITRERGWDVRLMCEGAFYQTDDDVLHMLLRTNGSTLWCSESVDDGEHWSEPFPTGMTDDGSKFDAGRLPDGRYYYVGNTVPGGGRNPLVLCLSEDGENFGTHVILSDAPYTQQFAGMYKGGLYGYPHTVIWQDRLWVICSKRKECIEVASVRLEDLP